MSLYFIFKHRLESSVQSVSSLKGHSSGFPSMSSNLDQETSLTRSRSSRTAPSSLIYWLIQDLHRTIPNLPTPNMCWFLCAKCQEKLNNFLAGLSSYIECLLLCFILHIFSQFKIKNRLAWCTCLIFTSKYSVSLYYLVCLSYE